MTVAALGGWLLFGATLYTAGTFAKVWLNGGR